MGQYYKIVFLAERNGQSEVIRLVLQPSRYYCGSKLMEHAYQGNCMMNAVEELIRPGGLMYRSRLVWAGDYAEPELIQDENLYEMSEECTSVTVQPTNIAYFRYIVNHSKRVYVDKQRCVHDEAQDLIHPLPLLTSEGNGSGGGDYFGNQDSACGSWARDSISVEHDIPEGYEEEVYSFFE